MNEFVHLHLHSEYSLLDGACRIGEIVKAAKAAGHRSVAITDHGALYGAVAFWRACKQEGIRPIIGCEVYVAPHSRFQKKGREDASGHHLVLLAENKTGYYNLMKLVSLSFLEGFYSKPRIDKELLGQYHEGLIALSACISGEIPSLILSGNFKQAKVCATEFDRLFGRGNFYLELQNHGLDEEVRTCSALRSISAETGIPLVATNDVHYLKKSDARVQTVLMCIQMNRTLTEGPAVGFPTDEFYYKSTEEMERIFPEDRQALENTLKIAERCNFSFVFGKLHLPTFPPMPGKTHRQTLYEETERGFTEKIDSGKIVFDGQFTRQAYTERISYELSVIDKMGFDEYYLIVQDFVRYAKSHGIPVGPGRGSGAGSLVAYCLSITDVDSLRYDLLFERFLNPERVSLPDFDIDFCYERRDLVLQYVRKKYGEDHVAQIISFGTLQAKAAIRDTARAMGISYANADRVARLIPPMGFTIADALKLPELFELYHSSSELSDLIDTAKALEGMPRHISTHAAGVVITEKPVSEYVPVSTSSGMPVAAYDMNTIADLGLVKFDFLGLRYLTVLYHAEENVRESQPEFCLDRVSFDDEATYRLLSRGDTDGVFQLESAGVKAVLMQMKPSCLEDITACIALYRPGPMDSIDAFIARKNGTEKIHYETPLLEPILAKTYGCIVYQEQVMQIFRAVGGYSFAKADLIRRAMSKKKKEVMQAERTMFLNGAADHGVDEATAGRIFDNMASFAKYAFNKSHATAYAFLSYRTAYMKTHYPAAYTAALLSAQQTTDISKCQVQILPPDINESRFDFSVSGDAVRYGFSQLKNIGQNFAQAIVRCRSKKPFLNFSDFIERMAFTELNRRQVESLIQCGAFDRFGVKRRALLSVCDRMIVDATAHKRDQADGQLDFFSGDMLEKEKEKPLLAYPDVPEYPLRELLKMEKEITGVCFSGHLLAGYSQHCESLSPDRLSDIAAQENPKYHDRAFVRVCGLFGLKTVKRTKKGDLMAFLPLEDMSGEVEIIVFPRQYEADITLFENENAVWVEGNLSIREGEAPKIIYAKGGLLIPNCTASASEKKKEEKKKSPRRLYLKLPSLNCRQATAVITLLHNHRGTTEVILYDQLNEKYVKAKGCEIKESESLMTTLKELLGDNAVRLQ